MKFLSILLLALSVNANAFSFKGTFENQYGDQFRVMESGDGTITVLDFQLGTMYKMNPKTGTEFPVDLSFLNLTRSNWVLENLKFVKSATIAGKYNSEGQIDVIVNVKVIMPTTAGDFNANVVLKGVLEGVKGYSDWRFYSREYPYGPQWRDKKFIRGGLTVESITDPTNNPANAMLFGGLNMVFKMVDTSSMWTEVFEL